jgi:hypothetical protein
MSGRLRTEDRLAQPDEFYQLLIEAHQGLSPEQSRQLDARLILLLANHLGDLEAIAEAVALARRSVVGERSA